MFGFRLQLKNLPDGRLVFRIPLPYRLLLLSIGALILASIVAGGDAGGIFNRANTIPLIICLLCFAGAAYHERWIFERETGRVIHQSGLLALHSNKVYGFSELASVEVRRLGIRGLTPPGGAKVKLPIRALFRLLLVEKSGRVHTLETYRRSQLARVQNTGGRIAEYCTLTYISSEQDPAT